VWDTWGKDVRCHTQEGGCGGCRTDPDARCIGECTQGGDDGVSSCDPRNVRYTQLSVAALAGGIEKKTWKEDSGRSTDLKVRQNVTNLLEDVANAFNDRIKTLTWVDNDRVA